MWTYQHSTDTDAGAAQVWACYADTTVWPQYDQGLERVTLDGQFAAGTRGRLVPRAGDPRGPDPIPFALVRAVADDGFTAETTADGLTLRFTHRLTALPGGRTRVTHGVEIDGPAAAELAPRIGPGITAVIPGIVTALIRVATDRGAGRAAGQRQVAVPPLATP